MWEDPTESRLLSAAAVPLGLVVVLFVWRLDALMIWCGYTAVVVVLEVWVYPWIARGGQLSQRHADRFIFGLLGVFALVLVVAGAQMVMSSSPPEPPKARVVLFDEERKALCDTREDLCEAADRVVSAVRTGVCSDILQASEVLMAKASRARVTGDAWLNVTRLSSATRRPVFAFAGNHSVELDCTRGSE